MKFAYSYVFGIQTLMIFTSRMHIFAEYNHSRIARICFVTIFGVLDDPSCENSDEDMDYMSISDEELTQECDSPKEEKLAACLSPSYARLVGFDGTIACVAAVLVQYSELNLRNESITTTEQAMHKCTKDVISILESNNATVAKRTKDLTHIEKNVCKLINDRFHRIQRSHCNLNDKAAQVCKEVIRRNYNNGTYDEDIFNTHITCNQLVQEYFQVESEDIGEYDDADYDEPKQQKQPKDFITTCGLLIYNNIRQTN